MYQKFTKIVLLFFTIVLLFPRFTSAQSFNYKNMISHKFGMQFISQIESNTMREHLIHKSTGNTKAHIKFHIFGDINEVFTQRFFKENFSYLSSKYNQNIEFIYHHKIYYVESQNNLFVSQLSECLAQQNKFWSNVLAFTSFYDIDKSIIEGVDKNKLKICLKDPTIKAEVVIDTTISFDQTGIGIPSFVIYNTEQTNKGYAMISGVIPSEMFEEELQFIAGVTLPTNIPTSIPIKPTKILPLKETNPLTLIIDNLVRFIKNKFLIK